MIEKWTVLWIEPKDDRIQMETFTEVEKAEAKAEELREKYMGCPSLQVIAGFDTRLCEWKKRLV
jgi:hypothetical protein